MEKQEFEKRKQQIKMLAGIMEIQLESQMEAPAHAAAAKQLSSAIASVTELNRLLKRSAPVHFGSVPDRVLHLVTKFVKLGGSFADFEVQETVGKSDRGDMFWRELMLVQQGNNIITILGETHKIKKQDEN